MSHALLWLHYLRSYLDSLPKDLLPLILQYLSPVTAIRLTCEPKYFIFPNASPVPANRFYVPQSAEWYDSQDTHSDPVVIHSLQRYARVRRTLIHLQDFHNPTLNPLPQSDHPLHNMLAFFNSLPSVAPKNVTWVVHQSGMSIFTRLTHIQIYVLHWSRAQVFYLCLILKSAHSETFASFETMVSSHSEGSSSKVTLPEGNVLLVWLD